MSDSLALTLPVARPVARGRAASWQRHRGVGAVLLVVGFVLVVGPIVGGVFGSVAGGRQLLDEFAPRLQADQMARYHRDVDLLMGAASSLDVTYAEQDVAPGSYPAIDEFRSRAPDIGARANDLLTRAESVVPDYGRLVAVGGFDRIPFLLVAVGLAATGAGAVVVWGGRGATRRVLALGITAGIVLAAAPFVTGLQDAGIPAHRMLTTLAPVMSADEVSALQADFVVVVTAVGVLDTAFRSEGPFGPGYRGVAELQQNWSVVSGDLADLVGTVNDNIDNYQALARLDRIGWGDGGFVAVTWVLVAIGGVIVVAALAAWPRRRVSGVTQ